MKRTLNLNKWNKKNIKQYLKIQKNPKLNESSLKTKKDLLKYLSYMVYFHGISDIKIYDDYIEIFNFKIPKW